MSTVEEILKAARKLSAEKQQKIITELSVSANDAWDDQIAADSAGGRLDFLVEEAEAASKRGELRDISLL